MNRSSVWTIAGILAAAITASTARADEVLYSYDGDVVPYDPSAGWEVSHPCEPPCAESIVDGHFVLTWNDPPYQGRANYFLYIADPGATPPPRTG